MIKCYTTIHHVQCIQVKQLYLLNHTVSLPFKDAQHEKALSPNTEDRLKCSAASIRR